MHHIVLHAFWKRSMTENLPLPNSHWPKSYVCRKCQWLVSHRCKIGHWPKIGQWPKSCLCQKGQRPKSCGCKNRSMTENPLLKIDPWTTNSTWMTFADASQILAIKILWVEVNYRNEIEDEKLSFSLIEKMIEI